MIRAAQLHKIVLVMIVCTLAMGPVFAGMPGGAQTPMSADTLGAPGSAFASAVQALRSGNVYIDPRVSPQPDAGQLERAALQGKLDGRPHTIVKIAILKTLGSNLRPPAGANPREYSASRLHESLGLGNNALILVVTDGKNQGASVWSDELKKDDRIKLEQAALPDIAGDLTGGTSRLAEKAANTINNGEYQSSAVLWVVFFLVVVVISGLLISAARRKKRELAVIREPIDALRTNVLSGIEYLDGYADVLPKNNPDSDQVRIFRQSASQKFEQATRILDRATETSDLMRAQGLLDRAQADVQQSRHYLDRATGGTDNIPGDDAMRPEPMPVGQTDVDAIPEKQRGVSYFSSQPAPLGSLVPVTITVNGESRQVLVTPEEAEEMRRGHMPAVRSFNVNGQNIPWYQYNGYDPYNDYWRYENSGWGGFGGGVAAGFIGAELLDSLFMPQYAGGYAPYAFATDMDYYRGYSDAQNAGWAQGGGIFGGDNGFNQNSDFQSGGDYADISGNNDGGWSNNDDNTDYSSGGDYGGDSGGGGGFDSGGDFGGGGDSGGGGDY